jgi:SacI restriction endonuclease.
MKIDFALALQILEEEAEQIRTIKEGGYWVSVVERLSEESKDKNKTMIAALGTAMLAKATDLSVDVYALHVGEDREARTYSARALCKEVLAANANRLGIDLGVSGREPLNNQPFFRADRISADLRVKSNAEGSLAILLEALDRLDKIHTELKARGALRAFLQVRQRKQEAIQVSEGIGEDWDADFLVNHIAGFVASDSEGGKRAQAIAAGLFDTMYGTALVDVRRINDPSRRIPGDIGIRAKDNLRTYDRVVEVKDKPITEGDVRTFIDSVKKSGISKAAMLAVSAVQDPIDAAKCIRWAEARQVRFRVFLGWDDIVRESLFWSALPGLVVGEAARAIAKRLVFYEVTASARAAWPRE